MSKINLKDFLHRNLTFTMSVGQQAISQNALVTIPIRIPKIQRDYAEGRESVEIYRKRRGILSDMLDVVYDTKSDLSFDFIYGNMVDENGAYQLKSGNDYNSHPNGAFEPLDGQQRLTTLFLMHWLFGRKDDLKDPNGHSLFVYETRSTSEEFCNWLVKIDADFIVKEWQNKVAEINTDNSEARNKWKTEKDANGVIDTVRNRLKYPLKHAPSLQDFMRHQIGFRWNWNDDPNIRSMITVLETALNIIKEQGKDYTQASGAKLDDITFLVLDNLVCDGDRLFEKMNARGKALSTFDILKSSLEEEMEQQKIHNSNPKLSSGWRTKMDSDWIDYWWDKIIKCSTQTPTLDSVKEVEKCLEKMLIRMIGLSFLPLQISGSAPTQDSRNFKADFEKSVSATDDNLVELYFDYARYERSLKPVSLTCLPFKSLYDIMCNILYQDVNGIWHNATEMLFKWNEKDSNTLFDDFFLKDGNPTHNTQVMMYGLVKYLEIIPSASINGNQVEETNFRDWMRFIRNVYNGDNKNARLDNIDDVKNAIKAIDVWLNEYNNNYYPKHTSYDCLDLICNYIPLNPNGQEQARLDEEKIKAELRLSGNSTANAATWEQSVLSAEDLPYLWGQIIAPLSWSMVSGSYNKQDFDTYVCRLKMIFSINLNGTRNEMLLIKAMLCQMDYRFNYKGNLGSLGRFNAHRDHSWKRYLRELDNTTQCYGILFKNLIDEWLLPSNKSLPFVDFLAQYVNSKSPSISNTDWRFFVVNLQPDSLFNIFNEVGTNDRYIFTEPNGHSYYFRSNTMRTSIRYELLTMYLYFETSLHYKGVNRVCVKPTSDADGALAEFKNADNHTVRLKVGTGALYDIECIHANSQKKSVVKDLDINLVCRGMKRLGIIK